MLFTMTRRILPAKSIIPGRFTISQPHLVTSSLENAPDDYQRSSGEKDVNAYPAMFNPTFKPDEFYRSDAASDTSIPFEHSHPPLQPAQPLNIARTQTSRTGRSPYIVRHSGESMYDLYDDPTYQSEMARGGEDTHDRSGVRRESDVYSHSDVYSQSDIPHFTDVNLDDRHGG